MVSDVKEVKATDHVKATDRVKVKNTSSVKVPSASGFIAPNTEGVVTFAEYSVYYKYLTKV